MSDFVWAHDTLTGASGPVARAAVEAFKPRFTPDPKHPVVDSLGELLPTKTKAAPKPPAAPAAKKPEEAK